jgi:outer membrane protein assembly factor BamB
MKRTTAAALTLAGALLGGCKSVPLAADPLSPSRSVARRQLFSVDWWLPLVEQFKLLELAPREPAQPALDAATGNVILVTRDGYVRAVGEDGTLRWSHKAGGYFNAGATVQDGRVYVPGGDGTLYALDAAKGTELWRYATGEELASPPVIVEGKVLVASVSDAVYAVESATGKWLWQYRRETPSGFTIRGVSMPAVEGTTAYLGFADGVVVALDVQDGTARWERQVSRLGGAFPDVDTTPVLSEGRLYVASYKDGLFALEKATGRVIWNTPTRGITHLVARGPVLYASGDSQVGAYLAESGQQTWSVPLPKAVGRQATLFQDMLVVPVQESLLFVDLGTGAVVTRWDPGQGVTAAPLALPGRLVVLSNLGYVYGLALGGDQG